MMEARMTRQLSGEWTPMEWLVLSILALFTLMAILGYGVFGLHPNLIPDSDSARRFYGLSFRLFARVHILLSALVLVIPLVRRTGFSWLPALLAVFLASFLSEFIGTGYGIPFGGYGYTGLLGFKLGGRVPAVIPLSWFLMALPSWAMGNAMFPGESQKLARAFAGGYLLTAWDLALDPAMSYLTPYWTWEHSGPFYGMPWVNLAGWMGTGMVLMFLLEVLGSRRWAVRLPVSWLSAYYGIVLLMPLGMVVAAGLWWALLATVAALAGAWVVLLALRARGPSAPEAALARGSVAS
jgi:uncharacterized membrane protein